MSPLMQKWPTSVIWLYISFCWLCQLLAVYLAGVLDTYTGILPFEIPSLVQDNPRVTRNSKTFTYTGFHGLQDCC